MGIVFREMCLSPWLMEFVSSMRIHKGSPIVPILSRINSVPCVDNYFFNIFLILSFHLRLGLPEGLFPADVPVKILKAHLLFSILATGPVHLSLLDLITLTMLGKRYKLWSSSLLSLFLSPFTSFGSKDSPQDPVFKYP
jgi:hypothetical protein